MTSAVARLVENQEDPRLELEQDVLGGFFTSAIATQAALRGAPPFEPRCPGHAQIWAAMCDQLDLGEQPTIEAVEAALRGAAATPEALEALRCIPRTTPAIAANALQTMLEREQAKHGDAPPTAPVNRRTVLRRSVCRFTLDELAGAPPPLDYDLFPYLVSRTVSVLSGTGGLGKSTLATYMAVCRALAIPFFGRSTPRAGHTVILTTEDDRDDYWRRLAALRDELGELWDPYKISERITLLDLHGELVRLVEADRGGNFSPTPWVEDIAEQIKEAAPGADLVIAETVSRLAGGVETNDSLSVLTNAGELLCKRANVGMLYVAHTSQDAGRAGTADQYAARGGSAFTDNARSAMVLARLTKENRAKFAPNADLTPQQMDKLFVLNHPKCKGPTAEPIILERHGLVLREAHLTSRQVDARTSLRRLVHVVAQLAERDEEVSARRLKRNHCVDIGVSQREVEELIRDALDAGHLAKNGKTMGGGDRLMLGPVEVAQ